MSENKRELRHAAEEAFQEALEQLQETFALSEEEVSEEEEVTPEAAVLDSEPTVYLNCDLSSAPNPPTRSQPLADLPITLTALEDAVNDIEQFLQNRSPNSSQSDLLGK
jgi:hypothetical protein